MFISKSGHYICPSYGKSMPSLTFRRLVKIFLISQVGEPYLFLRLVANVVAKFNHQLSRHRIEPGISNSGSRSNSRSNPLSHSNWLGIFSALQSFMFISKSAHYSYYNFTNELYCNLLSKNWGCQAPLGTYGRYAYGMRMEYLIRKITADLTVSKKLYRDSNYVTFSLKYAESNRKLVLVITRWAQSGAQSLNCFVPDCNAKASM